MQHSVRQGRARRSVPRLVSASIQQQSANFSYSDVEQGRTVFTIRASHATQFKDQNRALLEDVWITIYGKAGDRNDNIHTRECSYQPLSGAIRCTGEVQINLQGNSATAGTAVGQPLEIKTSDISFNRETGEASTTQPVKFQFKDGRGSGTGIRYSTHDSTMRIEHAVEFELDSQAHRNGQLASSSDRQIALKFGEAIGVAVLEGQRRFGRETAR